MAEVGISSSMFKKKSGSKRDLRTRDTASSASTSAIAAPEAEEANTVVVKKRKVGINGPLSQSTGFASIRRNKEIEDDDDEEDYRLDRYGESSVSSVVRSTVNDGKQNLDNRQDATRESDWYDNSNGGGRAEISTSGTINNDDGVYRGSSSYNTFITPRDDGISAKLKAATKGPIKGGNNVRTITVVDYQPDVCKDYKETGYCGFGDTCKFMHDRSDYLAGWQLDGLPNSAARQAGVGSDDDEEEEEVPFACLICRKPFTDPIVTKCGHYFCSACAVKRFSKTSKCFACGKQTQGIFNSAAKVLDRMEKARKVREEEREQKKWNRGDLDGASTEVQNSGEIIDGVEIGGDPQEN